MMEIATQQERLAFIAANPQIGTLALAKRFQVSRKTIQNDKRKLSGNPRKQKKRKPETQAKQSGILRDRFIYNSF
ncbi:hypothetical protein [Rufibacter quisquiliarum]|uniref:DeoR/GlpR family transcriptional regulator of sugar metabolism n=1 Tax=Rufibacter quisquiliarum TaxID=1549639 RepID=A0A839GX47_9BACT|nr:hypothetical protein [Rufibacter quisquiliarum]MBA9078301.1 DeoR/GlpR family transcriptional regulator of sugar metabolism [Rufibacter quisquiliarum]